MEKEQLIGRWELERGNSDKDTDQVLMEIGEDDRLTYTSITKKGTKQIILLTYRIDGDYIITDQPSLPQEEKTKVSIQDGVLVLEFEGNLSRYKKLK